MEAAGLEARLLDGAVVGVPGVVEAAERRISLATNVAGLEGLEFRPKWSQPEVRSGLKD